MSGHPGIEAVKKTDKGGIEAWRSWTAADRFYLVSAEAKDGGDYDEDRARAFFDSFEMLDRP